MFFTYQPGEVFWCNADVGWITGHSYVVYGPLLNGATIVLHEGVPNYPQAWTWYFNAIGEKRCPIVDTW